MSEKDASDSFLKEYPSYTLVHLDTGEGWDEVATYYFDFKKPDDDNVYREAWTFEQQKNGTWIVTGRWTPK